MNRGILQTGRPSRASREAPFQTRSSLQAVVPAEEIRALLYQRDNNLLMPPIDGKLFCSMLNILVTEVLIPVEIELTSAEPVG